MMDEDQITNRILMIRPARFGFNQETAASNSFQQTDGTLSSDEIAAIAIEEFDSLVATLLDRGVDVFVVEDTPDPLKTDAVFPNNWISSHASGVLVTYPMMSPRRLLEIREDILEDLQVNFAVNEIWRMDQESEGRFLEGTGSMVLDRVNRIAYACRSPRTDKILFNRFCKRLGFRPVLFDAVFTGGVPVYHTNVVMALTMGHGVVCLDAISDTVHQELVSSTLQESGKGIVDITFDQVASFAGNMLQIRRENQRPLLVMSSSARESLDDRQLDLLEDESEILAVPIPVIEKYGGGSVRCMLAEIFVEPRDPDDSLAG